MSDIVPFDYGDRMVPKPNLPARAGQDIPTSQTPAMMVVVYPMLPNGFLALASNQLGIANLRLDEITLYDGHIDPKIIFDVTLRGYQMATGATAEDAVRFVLAGLHG